MPQDPSEQSSYSVEEIMDRLREGEREKRKRESSEVVTRPDGSQVVRVRRRKRRSNQPHKRKEQNRKRLALILGVVAVVALLALVVSVLLLVARFNSKSFREDLSRRAGLATGAEASFVDFSVTPIRARARAASFRWPGNSVLKSLELKKLLADLKLRSMVGDTWSGVELLANTGTLELGWPQAGTAAAGPPESFPFDYQRYRCPNFEIKWSSQAGAGSQGSPLRLFGSEVTLRPLARTPGQVVVNAGDVQLEGWEEFLVIVKGGRIAMDGWDEFRVANGTVLLGNGRFKLRPLFLRPDDDRGGEVIVQSSGTIASGTPASFQVELDKIPLKSAIGPDLGGLVNATISSEAGSVECNLDDPESLTARIEFKGTEGHMSEFLFLSNLQNLHLRDSFFNNPTFGSVEGVFRIDKDGMSLSDLKFEQKSYLVVRGSIQVNAQEDLSGRLDVGVWADYMVNFATGKKSWDAFSDPMDGYCWITVELSGSLSDPKDDFSAKLFKAARESGYLGKPSESPEEAFERLSEP